MARTRLYLLHLKETKQGPESVTRFRGTGWEAAVLGGLPHADGPVGSAQLDVGERVYWNDTAAVIDVLQLS